MAYDDTVAEVRAREAAALQKQGNTLGNMQPGRGVVANMSQLGGMLGGQIMDATGNYAPEEQKARDIQGFMQEAGGPPKTQEEADALATKIHKAGYAKDAASMMKHYQEQRQGTMKTDKMEMENRSLLNLPALEADWNYGTSGSNFKKGYAKKWLGLKDEELAGINSEEDVVAAIEKFSGGLDTSEGRAKYEKKMKQYNAASKKAKDAHLGMKYRKDPLGKASKKLDLTSPATVPKSAPKTFEERYTGSAKTNADAKAKVLGTTPRDTSNDSLADEWVNVPIATGVKALGRSGLTVLDYITSGGLQKDVIGSEASDIIDKYLNQPITNLFK